MINRTKILCTIGPASEEYGTLSHMIEAGMNGARLNFSHGDHEEKKELADNSYLPSGSVHYHGEHDKCGTLDSILKQTLKNRILAAFLVETSELTHVKTAFYRNTVSFDILSFAPKNSPPIS